MQNRQSHFVGVFGLDDAEMPLLAPETINCSINYSFIDAAADELEDNQLMRTPSPPSVQTQDDGVWEMTSVSGNLDMQLECGGSQPMSVFDRMPHGVKACHSCGTTSTPQWRGGPSGEVRLTSSATTSISPKLE